MSNSIYKLYQENSNTELKEEFLSNVFDLLMEEELRPYVRDFQIEKGEKGGLLGNYNMNQKKLIVYTKAIEEMEKNALPSSLKAIEIIKNGLELARNVKRVEEGKDDITSTVVRYGLMDYAMDKGFVAPKVRDMLDPFFLRFKMRENEQLNPATRLAKINAWKYMVNLLKNQRKTPDLLSARSMLYFAYQDGYQNNRYHNNYILPHLLLLHQCCIHHKFYQFHRL